MLTLRGVSGLLTRAQDRHIRAWLDPIVRPARTGAANFAETAPEVPLTMAKSQLGRSLGAHANRWRRIPSEIRGAGGRTCVSPRVPQSAQ